MNNHNNNVLQNNRKLIYRPPPPPPLSTPYSSPGVQNSYWCSHDFMLGAGMVLIQENTHKIVVVHETLKEYWFFPRGRKDIGESLEQTALREAYEESGYRAEFMPLFIPHHAPAPPHDHGAYERPSAEPIFMSLTSWQPKRRRGVFVDNGGEYLTSWYVGRISEDAVAQQGTGMPNEQNYRSHLLSIEDAMNCVSGGERRVLEYAWEIYCFTVAELDKDRQGLQDEKETDPSQVPSSSSRSK